MGGKINYDNEALPRHRPGRQRRLSLGDVPLRNDRRIPTSSARVGTDAAHGHLFIQLIVTITPNRIFGHLMRRK